MADKQPALFDWATELSDAQGHVTLSAKEAHEIGARLRSMGDKLKAYEDLDEAASDVQLLRMGYAAGMGDPLVTAAPAAVAVPTFEDFCKRHGLDPKKMDGHGGMWARVALDECRAITTQPAPQPSPQADSQPAPDEIINIAREQGLPETEIEGVFRVNADDLCRVATAILAARATADSVLEDAARLDWLLLHISGAEFRRIGVHYSGNASRADVDAARKQGGKP